VIFRRTVACSSCTDAGAASLLDDLGTLVESFDE
jgi:hypothetical protein